MGKHVPFSGYDDRIADLADDPDLWLASFYSGRNVLIAYGVVSALAACLTMALYPSLRQSMWRRLPSLWVYYWGVYAMLPICIVWHISMTVNSGVHLWGEEPYVDGSVPHENLCRAKNSALLF